MNRYAILIANSEFPEDDEELSTLKFPGNDVDALKSIFDSEEYGKFTETITLKNQTKEIIETNIERLLANTAQDSLILIYYAGHGIIKSRKLFLATFNTESNLPNATSLSAEFILNAIKDSFKKKVILILDCCCSGAIGNLLTVNRGNDKDNSQGLYILTACDAIQAAIEKPGDQNGLLTKHIVNGIKNGNAAKDGFVTMATLYNYVYKEVRAESDQEPMKWENGIKGSELIIVGTGKLTSQNWRNEVTNLLSKYEFPLSIEYDILRLRRQEFDTLSDEDKYLFSILEKLWQEELKKEGFISEWETVNKKRLNKVANFYSEYLAADKKEDWIIAEANLTSILKIDPSHSEAKNKLEELQVKKHFANLYNEAQNLLKEKKITEALFNLSQIQLNNPDYKDVKRLINEAENEKKRIISEVQKQEEQNQLEKKRKEQQKKLEELYSKGETNFNNKNWDEAISFFQHLQVIDKNYKRVSFYIENAKVFREIKAAIDENDLKALVHARRKLNTVKHKNSELITDYRKIIIHQINDLLEPVYEQGVLLYQKNNWLKSLDYFKQVYDINPKFKNVAYLIKNVEEKIQQSKTIKPTEKSIDQATQLFQEALQASYKEEWVTAIEKLQEAQSLNPVKEIYNEELRQVQRQQLLAELYKLGQNRLQAKDWQAAIDYFLDLKKISLSYKDVDELILIATRKGKESLPRKITNMIKAYENPVLNIMSMPYRAIIFVLNEAPEPFINFIVSIGVLLFILLICYIFTLVDSNKSNNFNRYPTPIPYRSPVTTHQ